MTKLQKTTEFKIPSRGHSKEYELGTEIFTVLDEIGSSCFIGTEKPQAILIRLKRIDNFKKYCFRKEKDGYRFWRII